MNKLKFYKIASISLLLLNVVLVAAFLITKPKGGPGFAGRMGVNAQELLKLDDNQHELFLANVESHHKEMELIKTKKMETLKPFLRSVVSGDMEDINSSGTLQKIKDLEGEKLLLTYNHLLDVKKIMKKEQLPLFEDFLNQRLNDMAGKNEGRPHERR